MPHDVIAEAVALVVAAALIAYACFRIGLVPIVGFLVAGVIIGPHGLGLVRDQVAKTCSPELFLLAVIAICFGTAWLTNLAGVSLSLGAASAPSCWSSPPTTPARRVVSRRWRAR